MPSPGQILELLDQIKTIVDFHPRLISVIVLVLSFSRSQTPSTEEKIAFLSFQSFSQKTDAYCIPILI